MRRKTMLGMMGLVAGGILALVLVSGGIAGEWHSGPNNTAICFDCHTMHYSQAHQYDGTAGAGTPALFGGPNAYLLRQPVNLLCLACHDGQTFAPDVLGTNSNASPSQGRQAGAINEAALGAPYEDWKGHTLGSTATPPGYDPSLVGLTDWYPAGSQLECVNCHSPHGGNYRNLGPYAMSSTSSIRAKFRPTYVIGATNNASADVWINLSSYTAGSGNAATFNPYYDRANIFFNRNDDVDNPGSLKTSNRLGNFCAACHANFHGGPGNANIESGGEFIRHPTSQVTISGTRYSGATNKVKVFANYTDATTFTNPSPGCTTCHKAHGNQSPFGLIFMARSGGTITEEGTTTDKNVGIRNLCGQCHGMGN